MPAERSRRRPGRPRIRRVRGSGGGDSMAGLGFAAGKRCRSTLQNRHGAGDGVGYWLAKFVFLGPLLRMLWRPWVQGAENVPSDRPAIIASNHLSFCDSFFMPIVI